MGRAVGQSIRVFPTVVLAVRPTGGRNIKRLKRILQFSKPKGVGLEISKGYYLSVLAAKAQLPSPLVVLNPKGEGGAVEGMCAPLAADATKDDLTEPLKRGVYAVSSSNQKTLIKMMVMPKEEAGFDPSAFARSDHARSWNPDLRLRVESTWMIVQLTFESYDPQTYEALDFFLAVAKRLAELTDGVVADPVSQVYRLPEDVLVERPAGVSIAAADHVQAKDRLVEGTWHCYTLGLSKFHLPEVEVFGVAEANRATAARFLIGLAQSVLVGARLEPGATVGTKDAPLSVAVGGLDRGMWEGIPCVELIPAEGTTIDAALLSWYASVAK